MKKAYQNTRVEILPIEFCTLMIPGSDPGDPHISPLPERHWRPGPGASYDPQGSIV